MRRLTGDYPAAAQALEQALDIYRDLGDRLGQANALSDLGVVRRMTGDYPAAAQALEQALGIYRDLGDRGGEAEALNERGTLHRVSGELAQAEGCHQQALELARAIASSWDEAHALAGLGRCALAAGHATQAEVLLRQALEIFQRIGAAEAPDLLAELDALTARTTRTVSHGIAQTHRRPAALDTTLKATPPARSWLADGQIAAGRLYMEDVERDVTGIEQTVEDLSGRRPRSAQQ